MEPLDIQRGDVVHIKWLDIQEDLTASPDKPKLAVRNSIGIFWSLAQFEGVDILVTTTTLDEDGPEQQGYCAYPVAVIKDIKFIKRVRRKKVKDGEQRVP